MELIKDCAIMKKIFTFFAIACMALVSCTEEDSFEGKYSAANVGDEIVFGGSMSYKSNGKQTRTVYGDKKPGDGGYTEIKWYEGDHVRIYCEQTQDAVDGIGGVEGAAKRNYCDYIVTGDAVVSTKENPKGDADGDGSSYETEHMVGLENASDEVKGLTWGTTNPHTFYAVYPSPKMLSKYADDEVAANALKIENNKVTAYLPNLQRPGAFVDPVDITNADGEIMTDAEGNTLKHYTIHPAMRYAYMVALDEASPIDGGVDLLFEPIVTAVEMTLENKGDETIEGITMISLSSETAICGSFTTEISTKTISGTSTTDDSYKTVSVPVAADGSSITMKKGDRITFTAFMISNTDINKLGVTILYAGGMAKKSATLSGNNNVSIVQAKRKNFISNVNVNFGKVVQTVDIANWMAALPDETLVSGLSIPGAGGASSGNKANNAYVVGETSRQQNLNITELWNQGIRCFEFFVDNGSSFGGQDITCNGVSTGITLNTAVNTISSLLLNNPDEFAAIIVGYEEAYNNVTVYSRQAGDGGYGDYFNKWWSGYTYTEKIDNVDKTIAKDKIITECTTLGDARGRLFCIGRPVSIGIDPGWYTGIYSDGGATDFNCLYVLGWGNNPDQWYARGFGNLVVQNYINSTVPAGENTTSRPYVLGTSSNLTAINYTAPTTVSYYKDSNKGVSALSKYVYKATQSSHVNFNNAEYDVMVQEWRRVMPSASTQSQYGIVSPAGKAFRGLNNNSTDYYVAWSPSENEKWNDVVNTFVAATAKTGNYDLYINSLCGYFIDGNIALSYQPRPTFQRYYNYDGTFSDYHGVYLDDKYRDLGGNADNPGTALSNKTSPKTNTNWGPYNPLGGYQGNIQAFADWINNKFYNYLMGTTIAGSTGIIMMDRVSSDVETNPAGYYIPRIILANNPFPEGSGIEESSAMRISLDEEEVNSGNSDDYNFAAPEKR